MYVAIGTVIGTVIRTDLEQSLPLRMLVSLWTTLKRNC